MAQPFNYSLGLKSPMQVEQEAFTGQMQGLELQARMQQAQAQAIAEQQKAQQAALLQQQRQAAFDRLNAPDVTPDDYRNAALLGNKDQAEVIMKMMAQGDESKNRAAIGKLSPIVFALHANKPERAISALEQQKLAYEGNPEVQQELQARIDAIKADPEAAKLEITGMMSLIPGADKVLENLLKLTVEQRAVSAEKRAESKELREIEKQGWDIKKIQSDMQIARMNAQIAAASASASREGNDLKRQELMLKVEDMRTKRDETIRDKISEGQAAFQSLTNTKALIKDILSDEDTLRASVGSSAWRAAIPGTKARTLAGKIEQLRNAVAAGNLDKIKGAMSDKDLAFITNIESNLDRYQNEEAFISEVKRVARNIDLAADRVAKRYGIPDKVRDQPTQPEQPQGVPQGKTGVTVTLPNGRSFVFPNQQAADQFKARVGVR